MKQRRAMHLAGELLRYFVIWAMILVFMIPVYWVVSVSLKEQDDILSVPPKLVFKPTLQNYRYVLGLSDSLKGFFQQVPRAPDFPRHVLNSIVIGLSTVALAIMLGCPVAYALARFQFKVKKWVAVYILLMKMFPPVGIVIPFYIMFSRINLLDTLPGMILIHLTFLMPFAVWMMKGFLQEIPKELEEAAQIDGCTRLGALAKVIVPLAAPGIAAVAIFCFTMSWNEFLFAMVLTSDLAKTAPISLYSFITFREVIWGPLCAAGVLVTLPVVIFTLLVQKQLVRGLTLGAVKE